MGEPRIPPKLGHYQLTIWNGRGHSTQSIYVYVSGSKVIQIVCSGIQHGCGRVGIGGGGGCLAMS